MATSGSYNFTRTAGEIVDDALRKAGILATGEVASADQNADGLVDLNLMVKSWPAKGIDLWRYEELTVYMQQSFSLAQGGPNVQSYSIGPTGDNATFGDNKTELSVAAVSGASTITVDSASAISNGDNIGIVLDDGSLQWTTVNGAPVGNVVTLAATLNDDAAINNNVYSYTLIAQRPLRIYDGRLRQNNNTEIPMVALSRNAYKTLPTKESIGKPTQYYYDPQRDDANLFIWPVSDSVSDRLKFSAQRQIQDLDNTTDNLDFPQEWELAIVFNLAKIMAFDYQIPTINAPHYAALREQAEILLEEVEYFDVENASINMMPSDEDAEGWE